MSILSKLNFYKSQISKITQINNIQDLQCIEETMRHSVVHLTLDWQTAEKFHNGALKALTCIRLGAEKGYWELLNSDLEVQA